MFSKQDRDSKLQTIAAAHKEHIGELAKDAIYDVDELSIYAPANTYHPSSNSSSVLFLNTLKALNLKDLAIVEIGMGTGVVALQLVKQGSNRLTVSDNDMLCCAATCWNARRNNLTLDIRYGDLWAPFTTERYDVALFNPPLMDKIPETPEEASLCDPGGKILNGFLEGLPKFVKQGGTAYITYANISAELPARWEKAASVVREQRRDDGTIFQVLKLSL